MYDALTLSAIVDELTAGLIYGRVQQVAHVDALSVALEVYAAQRRHWLVLSADHDRARVLVHSHRVGVDPERISPFLLLLRKYVRGGRIVAVSQPHLERIIRISIAKPNTPHNADDVGEESSDEESELQVSEIAVEIMGRRSNIMLLDQDQRIRDSIKRVTPEMSRVRVVLPGRQYQPPPPQAKLDPLHASENDLLRDAMQNDTPLDRWLVNRYLAVSPALSREIVFRSGIDPRTPTRLLQAFDASRLVSILADIFAPLETAAWTPVAYVLPDERGIASPIRLHSVEATEGMSARPQPSMSAAVEAVLLLDARAQSEVAGRHAARRERLVDEISVARERAAQRVRSLEEQQHAAEDADTWRSMGEAIYAATGSINRGDTQLVTYSGDVVPLDPALSPSENATRYFERYRKAQSATANLPELLKSATTQLEALDQLRTSARQAEAYDDIELLRHEWQTWQDEVRGRQDDRKQRKRKQPAAARRVHSYRSQRGDLVWVGRTSMQNEHVTFNIASPQDLWLHARNMPGAHVVIRWAGSHDDDVLEAAASLAAYFSDGRDATLVPVDVTERRNVRRMRGAGPGMVTYRNERTLNVRPRSERQAGLEMIRS